MKSTSQCTILLVAFISALAAAPISAQEMTPVPLCRALERLEPGDQIPVVVSGIYTVNRLYDPKETECRLNVSRSICVEFLDKLHRPPEFDALHQESLRVYASFRGILYGKRLQQPLINDPTIPVAARLTAINRYCANYPTKLVVNSILEFERVPEEEPWPESTYGKAASHPYPIEIQLPTYPHVARTLHAEGSVLLAVEVVDGKVAPPKVQFGDPVLIEEAVANVQTWEFSSDVNTALSIEYEFRLEKRPASEGTNPTLEMRLPLYIRITGPSNDW